ncbi:MAG: hypothetical protein PHD48_09820 [Alphaproteobacteria bacterium]|nr:hypothetical protein [Alphaproteobacteria bacterium]
MTTHRPRPKHKEESEWPALLLGWIFIIVVLFGIVFMILHAKPERRLVCDDTLLRSPSLTKFGTCHTE